MDIFQSDSMFSLHKCLLTSVMLDIIHSNVCRNEGCPIVFLFILLFLNELGFGLFCEDDVFDLCTDEVERNEDCYVT